MNRKEKKASDLVQKAVSLELSGESWEAIKCAEKAIRLLEELDIEANEDRVLLYWSARYNYHIMRMIHDETADGNLEYEGLLRLKEEVDEDEWLEQMMYSDEGVEIIYLRLLFYLTTLRFKECGNIPEYEEIARKYQEIVEVYQIEEEGGFQHFLMSNLNLANFYTSIGNHMAAIYYYEKILNDVDEEDEINTLLFQILVNLCFAYLYNSEAVKARKLAKFLYESYEEGKIIEPLQNDLQRLVLVYANACAMRRVTGKAKELIVKSIGSKMIWHENENENDFMWVLYSVLIQLMEADGEKPDPDMLREAMRLSDEKEQTGQVEQMRHLSDKAEFYAEKAAIYFQMGNQEEGMRYIDKMLSVYLGKKIAEGDRLSYAACMYHAMERYAGYQEAKAGECAAHMMQQLSNLYSGAEYLLDNVQMEEYLITCRGLFFMAYSYFSSRRENSEALFVYSANYKNVLLSVVRGRTKKIYHDRYNLSVIKRINELRDELASGKNAKYKKQTSETKKLSEELKELEMEFASRHKRNEEMPFYSFESIMTVLPKNTALIEMIVTDHAAWKYGRTENLTGIRPEQKECLDVFLLVKDRTVIYRRICVEHVKELYDQIKIFKEKFMAPKTKYKKEAKNICDMMFGEFRELLQGVENIILSPNGKLYNLPFELAFESAWEEMAGKRYIYCQSVRDLFEPDFSIKEDYRQSCIIGSPKYSLSKEEKIEADRVNRLFDMEQIKSLPYSEYEAKAVADLLGCEPVTGKDASKYLVKPGYSGLHIATHGLVQEIGDRNIWYNSALTFAGVADWYADGKETVQNGNGLLTAEEISRMDLGTVNLVVLSACNSGTSSFTLYEQQSGLHLAFGVAGVKYVVSALWHVDDFATALLMKFFYEYLLEIKSVPGALGKAKDRLRTITSGEIFSLVKKDKEKFPPAIYEASYVHWENLLENYVPYGSPYYYAAFVCYQYKF